MKLFITQKLLTELDGNALLRTELALALEMSERGIYNNVRRCLEAPYPNCTLTKLAAVRFLESKGYTQEDIITEEQPDT